MRYATWLGAACALLGLMYVVGTSRAADKVEVDTKLAVYKEAEGVSGNIKSVGSDTMNNLVKAWGDGFKKHYPGISVEIEDKGSNTAPPALIKGAATFGAMSRKMESGEKDSFKDKFGYEPAEIPVAIDMLAVYVHKDNPIKSLTLEQVDAIFSKNRKGGAEKDATTWGDVGLKGEWADKPIALYGRNTASGTYKYFKEHALFKGDYKDSVKEAPGSAGVIDAVAKDKYGIGYSGIGYKTEDVRAIPLAGKGKDEAIAPEMANAYTGKYPLSRFLYLYVNYKPNSDLEPLRREFIRFVLSKEGQELVLTEGFIPLTSKTADAGLQKVGLAK